MRGVSQTDPKPTGADTVLCYLDVDGNWQTLDLPQSSLAFTWCQVPIIYRLGDGSTASLDVELDDGSHTQYSDLALPVGVSADLFARNGRVRKVTATLDPNALFIGDH